MLSIIVNATNTYRLFSVKRNYEIYYIETAPFTFRAVSEMTVKRALDTGQVPEEALSIQVIHTLD